MRNDGHSISGVNGNPDSHQKHAVEREQRAYDNRKQCEKEELARKMDADVSRVRRQQKPAQTAAVKPTTSSKTTRKKGDDGVTRTVKETVHIFSDGSKKVTQEFIEDDE